jgi:hypothetical protein
MAQVQVGLVALVNTASGVPPFHVLIVVDGVNFTEATALAYSTEPTSTDSSLSCMTSKS